MWLNTSGRSAITLASGISSPRKSGVRTSTLQFGACRLIWRMTPTNALRSVVGEVVAVDARDHRVPEAHPGHRPRDAGGLERVVPRRLAGLDVAEAAAAGAGVAEDHERGGAALPALADVRAGGLLADRVKVLGLDQALQPAVPRAAGRRHLEPGRLAGAQRQDVRAEDVEDVRVATGVGARPRRHTTKSRAWTCAGLAQAVAHLSHLFVARSPSCPRVARENERGARFLEPALVDLAMRQHVVFGLDQIAGARAGCQGGPAARRHRPPPPPVTTPSTPWCPGSCSSARACGWPPCSPAARARSFRTARRRRCTSFCPRVASRSTSPCRSGRGAGTRASRSTARPR